MIKKSGKKKFMLVAAFAVLLVCGTASLLHSRAVKTFAEAGRELKHVTVYQSAGMNGDLARWQILIEGYGLAFMDTDDSSVKSGDEFLVDTDMDWLVDQYEKDQCQVITNPWKVDYYSMLSGLRGYFHVMRAGISL